jgi:hypothetical protein
MRRVLVTATLLLTLTACGNGDDGDGVATAGGSKGTNGEAKEVDDDEARQQFAECMRENGVEMSDPDPDQPGRIEIRERAGDRDKVEKAMDKCRKLLPNGGEFKPSAKDLEALQKMAECMRDNGVPEFPDPDPNGGGIRVQKGSGMDPDDPKFQAAQEKCREFMPEPPNGGGPR